MMNVLILTGRFGMGHVAAAEAVQQEIVRRAPSARVDVVDIVEACRPELSGLVYGFFDFTVHYCSGVYNLLNRLAGRCDGAPLERQMRSRMERLLDEHRPDLVVSTLPLSSQYVAAYKRASGDPIPLYTYITDIYARDRLLFRRRRVHPPPAPGRGRARPPDRRLRHPRPPGLLRPPHPAGRPA